MITLETRVALAVRQRLSTAAGWSEAVAGKSKAEFEAEERGRLLAEDEQLQRAAGGASTTPPPPFPAPAVRPVQRQAANEANIIAKLVDLGFDPLALPRPLRRGVLSPAKQPTRAALGLSVDVMKKAWQRLSDQKRIKYADR